MSSKEGYSYLECSDHDQNQLELKYPPNILLNYK